MNTVSIQNRVSDRLSTEKSVELPRVARDVTFSLARHEIYFRFVRCVNAFMLFNVNLGDRRVSSRSFAQMIYTRDELARDTFENDPVDGVSL